MYWKVSFWKSERTYKIKIGKAGLHEENSSGEKVEEDQDNTLPKNKAIG